MRRTLSPPLYFLLAAFLILIVFLWVECSGPQKSPAGSLPAPKSGKTKEVKGRAFAAEVDPQSKPEALAAVAALGVPEKPAPAAPATERKTPAFQARTREKMAAVIMDDLGYNLDAIRALCALKRPVTASVLPYASETMPTLRAAEAGGLEIMLHLPLEPRHLKPGKSPEGMIAAGMTRDEIRREVLACLEQVPGCRGVNNHTGSKITEDPAIMPVILEIVKEKGLYFIDSVTSANSVAYETAQRLGVPAAERWVFLDADLDDAAIKAKIEELFRRARDTGRAVGICHPKPETIAALARYLGLAEQYGVTLVFASAIVD